MNEYIIQEGTEGRIDKVICELNSEISRVTAQRLIEKGKILVNGKSVKVSYKVSVGDIITQEQEEPVEIDLKAEDIPLDVIYEDDDILVVNKEKGMVVHPGNGNQSGTLVNAIMAKCKDGLSGIGGEIRPGIVHRLDKNTSGLLIVAKNDKAHINMSEQIKERRVNKTYLALVRGVIKENEAKIVLPIGRSNQDRKKMAVTKKGKEAITYFKVIKRYKDYTFIEVKIETRKNSSNKSSYV